MTLKLRRRRQQRVCIAHFERHSRRKCVHVCALPLRQHVRTRVACATKAREFNASCGVRHANHARNTVGTEKVQRHASNASPGEIYSYLYIIETVHRIESMNDIKNNIVCLIRCMVSDYNAIVAIVRNENRKVLSIRVTLYGLPSPTKHEHAQNARCCAV